MNGLTKENYFDAMTAKYPGAMAEFNEWIDEYKKAVNWNVLFNIKDVFIQTDDIKYRNEPTGPKFHDLPYEMQIGIIMDIASKKFKEDNIEIEELKELFESCLQALQQIYED